MASYNKHRKLVFLTIVLVGATYPNTVCAQRKVAAKQSGPKNTVGAVSQDLLDVYGQTGSAVAVDDFTKIARFCADVISNTDRSKVDRDYAKSLLSWALNRRGEVRGDMAAKLVDEGNATAASKMDRQAAEDFATALKYSPNNWRTAHNYAIALALQSNYEPAIAQFSRVIELNDQYANAYFNRGELYFETKRYRQASEDYSSAIELSSADPQYYNSRGHSQFMLADYESAINDYRQAVKLANDSAVYHTDLADALQFLGQWDEAARLYRAAIAINSDYGRAYQNAAWLMATCPDAKYRDTELALSAAKKARQLEGDTDFRTLDTLAAAMAASGDTNQAAEVAQQAVQAAPVADRPELIARMKLYQQGRPYLQPRGIAKLEQEAIPNDAEPAVVTASSTKRLLPKQP